MTTEVARKFWAKFFYAFWESSLFIRSKWLFPHLFTLYQIVVSCEFFFCFWWSYFWHFEANCLHLTNISGENLIVISDVSNIYSSRIVSSCFSKKKQKLFDGFLLKLFMTKLSVWCFLAPLNTSWKFCGLSDCQSIYNCIKTESCLLLNLLVNISQE